MQSLNRLSLSSISLSSISSPLLPPPLLPFNSLRSLPLNSLRSLSTLSPKPSSKKSKSKHLHLPSLPSTKLSKKKSLLINYNHVLYANKMVSKRERHWRRILIQSQCANIVYNPNLMEDVRPYWLIERSEMSGSGGSSSGRGGSSSGSSSSTSNSNSTITFNNSIVSAGNVRIIKSVASLNDPIKLRSNLNSNQLSQSDLDQVSSGSDYELPLIDRVIDCAEKEISTTQTTTTDPRVVILSRILAPSNQQEIKRIIKESVINAFKIHSDDSGSVQVQAAVLTLRIRMLCRHMLRGNEQDTCCRVLIDELISRRRKKMEYLRRVDFSGYMKLVRELGLKVA